MYIFMDAVTKEVKIGMGKRRAKFMEERRERRLTRLLYADELVLCGGSKEDQRVIVGRFVEVRRGRAMKVKGR